MNKFQTYYLDLLRRQVEEEINYLVRNGHDNTNISEPCMFCVYHSAGVYRCRRLIDLRQFLSSIASNQHTNQRAARRQIGQCVDIEDTGNLPLPAFNPSNMPLMYPKL